MYMASTAVVSNVWEGLPEAAGGHGEGAPQRGVGGRGEARHGAVGQHRRHAQQHAGRRQRAVRHAGAVGWGRVSDARHISIQITLT